MYIVYHSHTRLEARGHEIDMDFEADKHLVLGINGSTSKHGNSARNLHKTLSYIEKLGGKTEILHLLDLNLFSTTQSNTSSRFRSKVKNYLNSLRKGTDLTNRFKRYSCVNEDTLFLFERLLSCDGFVLSFPVHQHLPSSLTVAFMESLDILESEGYLLEGKVFGLIVNYGLEENGVAGAISSRLQSMGLISPPYGIVYCNLVSNTINRFPLLSQFLWLANKNVRLEGDGFSWSFKALAKNMKNMIELLKINSADKSGFWE